MRNRVALEEVEGGAKEANDGKGDNRCPKDDLVPGLNNYTQQEKCNAGLRSSDGYNQRCLANQFQQVGFGELRYSL